MAIQVIKGHRYSTKTSIKRVEEGNKTLWQTLVGRYFSVSRQEVSQPNAEGLWERVVKEVIDPIEPSHAEAWIASASAKGGTKLLGGSTTLTLRLPAAVKDTLSRKASLAGESINAYVAEIINKAL